ncbi:hypothetical protein KC992_01135 [Candidatus Saccharibacteria bacterium]|nr:hypothetical protein [Candidatus Saccharibacteria bacterium]
MAKETIYIEADDEITTVIDKVISAKDAIIAIVLPKRATVFQSVVNMKLIKKAAEESKKKIVLISSDSSIDRIAAVAGVHVAQSLTSKPAIPKKPSKKAAEETISSKELEKGLPESEAESESDAVEEPDSAKEEDPIEIDNTTAETEELPAGSLAANLPNKKKKKFKVPDFGSFQVRMTLGITALILLAFGWFFAFVVAPKAVVTINTDTSSIPVTFDFIVRTGIESGDVAKGVIPAKKAEVTKEDKVTAKATGEKDVGEKAIGSVTMSSKVCGTITTPKSVPSGTGVSTGGNTYITQETVSFSFSSFDGSCLLFDGGSTDIVAQNPGEAANTASGTDFAVSGRSDVSATGSASGGTSKKVKVVSKDDFEKAKAQLKGSATADATTELEKKLNDEQLQALKETIEEGSPIIKSSVAVDAEAEEFTVSQTVTYRMLGIKTSDLSTVLDDRVKAALGESKDKNIRNNGLEKAAYRLTTKTSFDDQTLNLQAIATIGPEFNETTIAEEVAGKKRGDIEKMLEARDGVRSVSVEYSPLWVTTTPKSAKKITIVVNELEN